MWVSHRHVILDGWLSVTHPGVRQRLAGFVAYPSSPNRHDTPSGALASSQLRVPLEFVADREAVTLLPLTA